MTVSPTGPGGAVAKEDEFDNTGLEDVEVTDIVIPRISIVHKEGRFKNNITSEEFETLDAILLGLVKQRIMWDDEVDEGDKPQCKSPDFQHGFPNMRDDIPKDKRFPWARSNFDPSKVEPDPAFNNLAMLPCASCIFKEWDKGDWKAPPCNEQHTYPLLYTPDQGESWLPALFTTQRTGIKPSKQYISGFAQAKQPMFTVRTTIGLNMLKRGINEYSVPFFKRGEQTDRDQWPVYGQQLRQIRDFIRSAPSNRDEDEETTTASTANVNTGPSTPPATEVKPEAKAEEPPAAAPAAAPEADDDLPF